MSDMHDDDELLAELGVEVAPLKHASHTPREERIIAGFEDILRFHEEHGRAPLHGENRDIFERLYAVRLDQLRKLPEAQTLLAELDTPGLLSGSTSLPVDVDALDEDALLAELGLDFAYPTQRVLVDPDKNLAGTATGQAGRGIEQSRNPDPTQR